MRPRRCRSRAASAGLIWSVLLLSGCGGAPESVVHVSGTVTFGGRPLPAGMIVFEPDPAKGNRGRQGHAEIKGGRFDTRASGQGAATGPQVVRITGGDGANPEPFTPFGRPLFEEHSVRVNVSGDRPVLQLDVPNPKEKKKP